MTAIPKLEEEFHGYSDNYTFPNGQELTKNHIARIIHHAGIDGRFVEKVSISDKTSRMPPLLCFLADGGYTSGGGIHRPWYSKYTINLETLRPTSNSRIKKGIPLDLYEKFGGEMVLKKKGMKQTRLSFSTPPETGARSLRCTYHPTPDA